MPKTTDTTRLSGNRNSSDLEDGAVPILDDESEQLRLRIKGVVESSGKSVRSFADDARIGPTSLRNYMSGERKPKRDAIEKIAFLGGVTPDWLAFKKEPKYRNGVTSYATVGSTVYTARENQPVPELVNAVLLNRCLVACRTIHGEAFMKALISIQLEYAVDFYNQLLAVVAAKGNQGGLDDFLRLTSEDFASQLRSFLQMGWARKFPIKNTDFGSWS